MDKTFSKTHTWLRTYRGRLFLAILACSFIPLIFMGYLSYRFIYHTALDETLQNAIRTDNRLNVQLESRIRQVENVANSMQYNVYAIDRQDQGSALIDVLVDARSTVSMYIDTFDLQHIMIFLSDDDSVASEGLYYFPYGRLDDFDFASTLDSHSGTSSIWFLQEEISLPTILFGDDKYQNLVGCARINREQQKDTFSASFVILLKPDELGNMIRSSFSETNISGFLIDDQGYILAHSDASSEGTYLSTDMTSLLLSHAKNDAFLFDGSYYHVQSLSNGWYQIAVIPTQYLFSSLLSTLFSLLAVFLLAFICVLFMTQIFSKTLSRRLNSLANAMNNYVLGNQLSNQTRNELIHAKAPSHYDEFDQLGHTFMVMSDSIVDNMNSIVEMSLAEERLRYQLLQSQINPHFLYNILGTIRTCNSLGKTDTANQMIDDLTQFYRMTLHKSQEMITIKDEIQISCLYLQLEKLCHSMSLDWEFNLDDGIENFYICKFTLQPFLENCIHYGYSATISNIKIVVTAEYDDDYVKISIYDNGVGITDEKLLDLHAMLERHSVDAEHHFGICSVAKRISSPSYGNGSLQIERLSEGGTLVTLRFLQITEFTNEEIK